MDQTNPANASAPSNGESAPSSVEKPQLVDALPRRVEMPPGRGDKLRIWGLAVVLVLLCLAPYLIELGAAHPSRSMEKISLASSQETWMRIAGQRHRLYGWPDAASPESMPDANAWMVPSWNGRPRINKPPMLVWLNTLAWTGLDPATVPAQVLMHRARLVGVLLVGLALAATFWAGYSIGRLRTAAMALLITGSFLFLIKQGRIASYDTHLFGWVTLSVAAGLWAMRPLKPENWISRRVGGWVICGAALGAAILTKGPIALLFMSWPLVVCIAVIPRRRLGNLMGLLFAVMLGLVVAAPWYMHIIERMPGSWQTMLVEYQARRAEADPPWYYLAVFLMALPWTVWLIAALFQPWVRAKGEYRRQLLVAWLWFVGVLLFFSIPDAKKERYILPALPAAGLLIAQLWAWHSDLADQRRKDPGVNLLRLPHWLGIAAVSLAIAPFWAFQDEVVGWISNLIDKPLAPPQLGRLDWWVLVPWGAVLVVLCAMGIRWHWRWKPMHAAVVTALWTVVLMTVVYGSYVHSPHGINTSCAEAERVRQLLGHYEFRFLYDRAQDRATPARQGHGNVEPNEEFLFFVRRIVEPIRPSHLDEYARRPAFLMVRYDQQGQNRQRMNDLGYTHVTDFDDGRKITGFVAGQIGLYRTPADPPTTHANHTP